MSRPKGFTLIELMIVVAILGLLALIAIPRFAQMIRKSNEAGTRGHLGSVRSAISIYYSDQEGQFPSDLTPFFTPGSPFSLSSPPKAYTVEHGTLSAIDLLDAPVPADDNGHWGYIWDGTFRGVFLIVCTHQDLTGHVWSQY